MMKIRDIQSKLCEMGYLSLAGIDGIMGPITRAAISTCQRDHDLPESGIVDAKTELLLSQTASDFAITDGWSRGVTVVQSHRDRIGASIKPRAIVLHTTDTVWGTGRNIVNAWRSSAGQGQCAHYLINHNAARGVYQMCPTNRNGNHAGGTHRVDGFAKPWHGWYRENGKLIHPNAVSIGIEIENPGKLTKQMGRWIQSDTHTVFTDKQVYIHTDGTAWGKLSDYQIDTIPRLLDAVLKILQAPPPPEVIAQGSYIDNRVAWARPKHPIVVGHASLIPDNKTDPGPEVMAIAERWLVSRGLAG